MVQESKQVKVDKPGGWKLPLASVLIAIFVYCAFQFSDPNFTFVPKRATITRSYLLATVPSRFYLDENEDNVVIREVTVFEWESSDGNFSKIIRPEIEARDFAEVPGKNAFDQRTFQHKNGDAVTWEAHGPIQGMTTSGVCVSKPASVTVTYVHTEERYGHAMVKKLINWFRRL